MLFNSYEFLFIYLPVVLAGFFILGKQGWGQAAMAWLGGLSLIFYAWWNPVYLGLLLTSILFNFWIGRLLGKHSEQTPGDKSLLIFGVVSNLSLLAYYKYAGFFVANINQFTGANFSIGEIILPLGISFFTFTQIAFLVDAYRKEVREYGFIHYLLFVTFFPHLIAGPVLHHAEIMPQFAQRETLRPHAINFAVGFSIFFIGLFKKVVIADGLALYASPIFAAVASGEPVGGMAAWGGALAYTFQIYFDFSGYSDMAIGLARMFGIVFPANFNSPYKAASMIEFWRCWHMTLSRFLRDYLYIPLGGSRCARWRSQLNLLLTMLLGGLWHGAGWTFIVWGALHGIYLMVNHLWRYATWLHLVKSPILIRWVCRPLSILMTFLCVVFAWVFFRAESFDAALLLIYAMLGVTRSLVSEGYYQNSVGDQIKYLVLCAVMVWALPNAQDLLRKYRPALETYTAPAQRGERIQWSLRRLWAVWVGLLGALAIMNMSSLSEFLYFQF